MFFNFLKLNSDKTGIIVIGPETLRPNNQSFHGPLSVHIRPIVFNLEMCSLILRSFEKHANKVIQSCFYHLRDITKIQ